MVIPQQNVWRPRPAWVVASALSAALFLAFVCGGGAVTCMPHRHSTEGRHKRSERGVTRGFVRPAAPGFKNIQVHAETATAAKAADESLFAHFRHDGLTKQVNHFGGVATLHAQQAGLVSSGEATRARLAHKRAGRLKHNISARSTSPPLPAHTPSPQQVEVSPADTAAKPCAPCALR